MVTGAHTFQKLGDPHRNFAKQDCEVILKQTVLKHSVFSVWNRRKYSGLCYALEKPRLSSRSCSSLVLQHHEVGSSKTTWWQVAIPGLICSDINIGQPSIQVFNLWKCINTSKLPSPAVYIVASVTEPWVFHPCKILACWQVWLLSFPDSEGQLDPPTEFWNDSLAVHKPPEGAESTHDMMIEGREGSLHHLRFLIQIPHSLYSLQFFKLGLHNFFTEEKA